MIYRRQSSNFAYSFELRPSITASAFALAGIGQAAVYMSSPDGEEMLGWMLGNVPAGHHATFNATVAAAAGRAWRTLLATSYSA
jgi:hypothetical protein